MLAHQLRVVDSPDHPLSGSACAATWAVQAISLHNAMIEGPPIGRAFAECRGVSAYEVSFIMVLHTSQLSWHLMCRCTQLRRKQLWPCTTLKRIRRRKRRSLETCSALLMIHSVGVERTQKRSSLASVIGFLEPVLPSWLRGRCLCMMQLLGSVLTLQRHDLA